MPIVALLDLGSQINIVDERFAIEHDFEQLEDVPLPTLVMPNTTTAPSYKAFKIPLRLTDSWKREQETTIICYSITNSS